MGSISKILLAVVAALLAACSKPATPAAGTGGPPPPKIPVVQVESRDVPIFLEAVGELVGSVDIDIRARVDGVLEGLHFEEGFKVAKGADLYTIDPKPYESRVREAEGKVAEATARFVRAEADLKRIRPLVEIEALSERTLDQAVGEFDASKGLLQAAEASLENARIELGYTRITSPIDGLIGRTEAKVGEYVGRYPNPVVLNTVSKIDPINVEFSISEREYLTTARRVQAGATDAPAAMKENAGDTALELYLSDGSLHPHRGVVELADRQINADTGTLLLEATFPNPARILRPGQFARVRAIIDTKENAAVIPQRCVRELQGIYQVFVISEDGKVDVRRVSPGTRFDDMWQIDEGVKPGEWVAIEGLQKLRPGMTVVPAAAASRRGGDGPGKAPGDSIGGS